MLRCRFCSCVAAFLMVVALLPRIGKAAEETWQQLRPLTTTEAGLVAMFGEPITAELFYKDFRKIKSGSAVGYRLNYPLAALPLVLGGPLGEATEAVAWFGEGGVLSMVEWEVEE